MGQTSRGAKKGVATIKAKYGKNFYRNLGRLGGSTPTDKPKGFAAMPRERIQEIARNSGGGRKPKGYVKAKHV